MTANPEMIEADVAIVGSGVAGALIACELAKKGIRNIVILEAGPRIERNAVIGNFIKNPATDFSSGYPNPDHAPRPDWTKEDGNYIEMTGPLAAKNEYLRVVGGSTWHWSASTPRFHPADFKINSLYGRGVDWPIDYKTIAPFYALAEAELGVAGDSKYADGSPRDAPFPMPAVPLSSCDKILAEKLGTLGISFFSRPVARATEPYQGRSQCHGFGSCMPICPSGAQYSAIYHVERAEKLGVRVLDNTRVDRIVENGLVTHLEAKRPDGTPLKVTAKIFVVAANGVETPRLLLMSAGESRTQGIANSSGQVGRNFMDHPTVIIRLLMPTPVWQGRGPVTIIASHDFRDGNFRRNRPSWLLSTDNRPHVEDVANELINTGVEPPALDALIREKASKIVHIEGGVEQLPDIRNGINLDWTRRDRAGQPIIQQYYSLSPYEQEGLKHIQSEFRNYASHLKADVLAEYGPFTSHHQVGMTRMGNDARTSVTDAYGRSHDHKNLFLAGASLFPSAACVNPTLTIAALAIRSAGEIAHQLSG